MLVKELAVAVKQKAKSSLNCNCSGYIVNTCGWVKGDGFVMFLFKYFDSNLDMLVL